MGTSPNKLSDRDHNFSEGKNSRTNKNQRVVEEGCNNTSSKFKGLIYQQHKKKDGRFHLIIEKLEHFHSLF